MSPRQRRFPRHRTIAIDRSSQQIRTLAIELLSPALTGGRSLSHKMKHSGTGYWGSRQQEGLQGGASAGGQPGPMMGNVPATCPAGALISFSSFLLAHRGQGGCSPARTSSSNSAPQSEQRYSKIGISECSSIANSTATVSSRLATAHRTPSAYAPHMNLPTF